MCPEVTAYLEALTEGGIVRTNYSPIPDGETGVLCEIPDNPIGGGISVLRAQVDEHASGPDGSAVVQITLGNTDAIQEVTIFPGGVHEVTYPGRNSGTVFISHGASLK